MPINRIRFHAHILEALGHAVIATDLDGAIVYWNEAAEHMFGWKASEVLGRSVADITPAGTESARAEALLERLAQGERWTGEFELRRRDGSVFPALVTDSPVHNDDGQVVGVVGVSIDLTERRREEQERERLIRELEVERARLASLFEQAPAFIAVMRGPRHVIEMVNPLYRQLLSGREVVGLPASEAVPELERQGLVRLLDEVYHGGHPHIGHEVRMPLASPAHSDSEMYANIVYQPIRDATGATTGVFCLGVDITELVRARREAETADRAKAEFLAVMSHELRTPLTAVIGYTELLMMGVDGPLTDAQRERLKRVIANSLGLRDLIGEILDFSRMQTELRTAEPISLNAAAVAREVVASQTDAAREKGLEMRVTVEDTILRTDEERLRRILGHLLSNAVKFTERGHVELRLREEAGKICFDVCDTGPGIEADHMERIFEPFVQIDQSTTRGVGGTGLGLAMVRRLVETLGGELEVETTPDVGSTFTVRLPREPELLA